MANWQGYFGIENLARNASQKATLITALRALGPGNDPHPAYLCHWRTRLDGDAAIFEALFDEATVSIQAFKDRLGTIFGIEAATINHAVQQVVFSARESAVVTFSRSGTDYLRAVFFGYDGATWPAWDESRAECTMYLQNHAVEWESVL